MTEHDRERMIKAQNYLQSREALCEVLAGLQSTDAPELVPLHDAFQAVLAAGDKLWGWQHSNTPITLREINVDRMEPREFTTTEIPAKYFTTHDITKTIGKYGPYRARRITENWQNIRKDTDNLPLPTDQKEIDSPFVKDEVKEVDIRL